MDEINEHGEEERNAAINHDDEEFSDEEDELSNEVKSSKEVMRRIERNDPDFVDLTIGSWDCLPHHDDWERFGESVEKINI